VQSHKVSSNASSDITLLGKWPNNWDDSARKKRKMTQERRQCLELDVKKVEQCLKRMREASNNA